MANFTPGPWTVSGGTGYGNAIAKDGKSFVAVWPTSLDGTVFPHEANACLIVAAPDMFAALEYVWANVELEGEVGRIVSAARKKARGEQVSA